jgi:LysR family glycine cleavage system transcriptional activator
MNFSELPPLAFLPAVEAAGRLGSFKAAAAELHITPSAVSQQVKAVEDALGIELFARQGRSVEPTADGRRYLLVVRQALRELHDAGRSLQKHPDRGVLRIDTLPFVAHEFLLPRVASLHARFPSFRIALETSMGLVDLTTSEVDATIRLGTGPWPGLMTRPFGTSVITLVCSPEVARGINKLEDLAGQTLIEIRSLQERGLLNLMKGLGIPFDPSQVQMFDTYFETVRAAEHGLGVAYGMFPFTTEWVTSGRLAVPFALRGQVPGHVSLVHRVGDERFPFSELAAWLKEEYEALPALPAGRIVPRRSARRRA